MAFTNSYTTALKKNGMLAVNHDIELLKLKNEWENCAKRILSENPNVKYPELAEKMKDSQAFEYDVS